MAEPADVLVIGGGIAGAACAREAARRGLRVTVLESHDIASGTSGASTRLAHGGLRYLQQLDLRQVREGLHERAWLVQAAPHLVEPVPFLIPIHRGERAFAAGLRMGLLAYDGFAPRGWPRHGYLGAQAARAAEPALRGAVQGAARFHDGRIRSVERLVVEFLVDAGAHGATVRTHTPVEA
ncbi:MAG: FAD-dependent oxidoreductase, partial [Halobacteriales archaeon]|nr:FAD-dependent oxidoreductase [Halobacteriales archaeon]